MQRAITTHEASQMATATMKGVNNPRVWDVCYKAFMAGLTQENVNDILRNLQNKSN